MTLLKAMVLAVGGFCVLAACSAEYDPHDPAFQAGVAAVIADHPELVANALGAARAKQQAAAIAQGRLYLAAHPEEIFNDPDDPVITAKDPGRFVTLVVWTDYGCPFCKAAAPWIDRLIANDPSVRVIFKELAILGPVSRAAAKAAFFANREGRYLAFRSSMMADKTPEHQLTEAHILEIGQAVGLNSDQMRAAMADPVGDQPLDRIVTQAQGLALKGTPGFVIGNSVVNIGSYDELTAAITAQRRIDRVLP